MSGDSNIAKTWLGLVALGIRQVGPETARKRKVKMAKCNECQQELPKREAIEFHPTEMQTLFLQTGRWFLDSTARRGQGRSTAAAWIAIQLLLSGQGVYLVDPTIVFSHGTNYAAHRHFSDLVIRMLADHYPDVQCRYNKANNLLSPIA